jgi:hypothetical protein
MVSLGSAAGASVAAGATVAAGASALGASVAAGASAAPQAARDIAMTRTSSREMILFIWNSPSFFFSSLVCDRNTQITLQLHYIIQKLK